MKPARGSQINRYCPHSPGVAGSVSSRGQVVTLTHNAWVTLFTCTILFTMFPRLKTKTYVTGISPHSLQRRPERDKACLKNVKIYTFSKLVNGDIVRTHLINGSVIYILIIIYNLNTPVQFLHYV